MKITNVRRRRSGTDSGRASAGKKNEKQHELPHPSLDIVSTSGTQLQDTRIILCISGSVAAYKAIELARLLMRHGCSSITCVASKAATKLIRPAYLKWATGNDVITDLTGNMEHVKIADYGKSDLVIVYPATANTIGRLANGMDDAPVSTILTVALGAGIPIMVCPAMHESMHENPAVARNIEFLSSHKNGIVFVGPHIAQGKARVSEPEEVLEHVISKVGTGAKRSALWGKSILLTAGPTIEHIDPVRVITNTSTGRTGVLLAAELIAAGARVSMIYGPGGEEPPKGADVKKVETSGQMQKAVRAALEGKKFDAVVMAAAVSDYTPVKTHRTKIKSDADIAPVINLKKTPKIIDMVKKIQPDTYLVGFKAEADISKTKLVESARKTMARCGADMMIANDVGKRYQGNTGKNNAVMITLESLSSSQIVESGWRKKETVARIIAGAIMNGIKTDSNSAAAHAKQQQQ